MRTLIPSKKNNHFVYVLGEDDEWRHMNEDSLSPKIRKYETYGDGTTQHCPTYNAATTDLLDFCYSLAGEAYKLLTAPNLNADKEERIKSIHDCLPEFRTSSKAIEFASKVTYKDDPTRYKVDYFNFREEKISSSQKYQHDKRWTAIPSFLNGQDKVHDIFWVLREGHEVGRGELQQMMTFFAVADYLETHSIGYDRRESFKKMFPRHIDAFDGSDWDCVYEYGQAISIYTRVYDMLENLLSITRSVECYEHNITNRETQRIAAIKQQAEQKELVTA